MGISGLSSWIKKTRPEALNILSKRFLDPRLRNKRVAIDATLITNQFHFGSKDGPGKNTLVAWYTLIKEMRNGGVEPIAIWDERGVREWKAAEAQKRLSARALLLARRNHEDERLKRLRLLNEAMTEWEKLPYKEQEALRFWYWRYQKKPVPAEELQSPRGGPAQAENTPTADEPGAASPSEPIESIEPTAQDPFKSAKTLLPSTSADSDLTPPKSNYPSVASLNQAGEASTIPPAPARSQGILDKLKLIQESRDAFNRSRRSHQIVSLRQASVDPQHSREEIIQHVRDLEVFTGRSAEGGVLDESEVSSDYDSVQADNPVDHHLIGLIPPEEYKETYRQAHLSQIEEKADVEFWNGITGPMPPEMLEEESEVSALPDGHSLSSETSKAIGPTEVISPSLVVEDARWRAAWAESDSRELRASYARALALPTRQDHERSQELLTRLGVPVLTAHIPYEAEGLASTLAKRGLADYVATEDSDVLAYEGPLLRSIAQGSRPLSFVSGSTLRSQLELTSEQYLEFCILLGTDASPRIPGVGPVNAYKLIKEHSTIENILENEPKLAAKIPEGFMEMVANSRKVFTNLPPIPADLDLRQGAWNDEDVKEWMEEEHGLRYIEIRTEDGKSMGRWLHMDPGERVRILDWEHEVQLEEDDEDISWLDVNYEEEVREALNDLDIEFDDQDGFWGMRELPHFVDEEMRQKLAEAEMWHEIVRDEIERLQETGNDGR